MTRQVCLWPAPGGRLPRAIDQKRGAFCPPRPPRIFGKGKGEGRAERGLAGCDGYNCAGDGGGAEV
ncbi:hypothetical protein GCM10011341_11380 [Frigidibacter albus]|nr:hypothetical protein GCM10011341_11380 [Frigidibacter albus]